MGHLILLCFQVGFVCMYVGMYVYPFHFNFAWARAMGAPPPPSHSLSEQVTVRFSDNHAVLASNLYMSRLDWHVCSSPFFYISQYLKSSHNIIDWPLWEFG